MRNGDNLRQLSLLKILYERTDENHSLSTNELATILNEEYGISAHRITIKDDIISFQKFGVEIAEERKSQNYYRLITRTFTVPELKILIDAIQSAKFITASQSADLSARIATLASCHEIEALQRHITVEERYKTQNMQSLYIVDAINTAINRDKKISFRYFSYSPTKRKVPRNDGEMYVFSPYYLVWNGDHYYAVGYSDKHKGIGTFRVDRIPEVPAVLDAKAVKKPAGFSGADFVGTNYRMFAGEAKEVTLICDCDTMDSMVDRFGEKVETELIDSNHFILKAEVAESHVFYAWLFGFGGKVKLSAPNDMKATYEKLLKDARKQIVK